jgi:hypothetical protein
MAVRSQGYRRERQGRLEMAPGQGEKRFSCPACCRDHLAVAAQRRPGLLSRAPDVTAARLLRQREQFLSGGRAVLNKRPRTLRMWRSPGCNKSWGKQPEKTSCSRRNWSPWRTAAPCHSAISPFPQPGKLDSQLPEQKVQGLAPGKAPHHFPFSGCGPALARSQMTQLSLTWVRLLLRLATISLLIYLPVPLSTDFLPIPDPKKLDQP